MDIDQFCPHCKKSTFLLSDHKEGTVICQSCGIVLDEIIEHTVEYRQFENDSGVDRQRVGGIRDNTLGDYGLSLGVNASSSSRASCGLKKMNMILSAQPKDQSLIRGKCLINIWGDLLNLKIKTLNTAKEQFCKIQSKMESFRGRSLESVVAAVLLIATKLCSIPLKPDDIAKATGEPLECINREYNALKDYVDYIPYIDSSNYCSNFCVIMKLPHQVSVRANEIADDLHENGYLDGCKTRTVAAVAIYITTLELSVQKVYSLKIISEKSDISAPTIRKAYKKICENSQGKYKN